LLARRRALRSVSTGRDWAEQRRDLLLRPVLGHLVTVSRQFLAQRQRLLVLAQPAVGFDRTHDRLATAFFFVEFVAIALVVKGSKCRDRVGIAFLGEGGLPLVKSGIDVAPDIGVDRLQHLFGPGACGRRTRVGNLLAQG